MGRILTPTATVASGSGEVQIVAAEALAVGDLAVKFEGVGDMAWTENVLPYKSGEIANTQRGSSTTLNAAAQSQYHATATLRDGTIVAVHHDQPSGNAMYSLIAPDGSAIKAAVTIGQSSGHAVCALRDGGFVIVAIGGSGYPCIYRIDDAGTVLTNGNSVENSAVQSIDVAATADGGFVVGYGKMAGTVVRFARYDASAVLQGAITSVETSTAPTIKVAVCALAAGGFVVAYSGDSNYPKFARYNAAGALQGAVTLVEGVSLAAIDIAGLADGGFLIAYGTTHLRFGRYNASGALQGALTNAKTSVSVANVSVVPLADRGFALVYVVGAALTFVCFSATGAQRRDFVTLPTTGAGWKAAATALRDGGIAVLAGAATGANPATLYRYSTTPVYVVGVVTEAAAAGGTAKAQTIGVAATTRTWTVAGGFDHTNKSTPGNKGVALGKSLIIGGLSWTN